MTTAAGALLVVQLLVKGPAFLKAAKELAEMITAKGEEDLTPEEVAPYLLKVGKSLRELEEILER